MPLPVARSYIGIAKDATTTTLAAAVAAGATTVTTAAAVAASSTIFIWDGPLSESRAVTAGGGTTSLTVAALTNAHPANCYVTVQLTASVGPTDYIPVTSIEPEDVYKPLEDKGLRGSLVETYGVVQGPSYSNFTVNGDCFADTVGYWLGGVLGATDFTAGTPNQHDFSVKNTTTGQPTAFTLYDFDVVNTRGFPMSRVSEVGFKFDGEGLLTYSAKTTGTASGVVSTPTPSFSAVNPTAVWTGLITIGGTVVQTLVNGEITIKRPVSPVQTIDSAQGPYTTFSGPVSCDGKLTFVMEDDSQLLNFINNSQPSLDINFATGSGATATQVKFHLTKAAFTTGKVNRGKDYVQVDIGFMGIANTTDATVAGTGYSPLKATIKNAKATGTYQ